MEIKNSITKECAVCLVHQGRKKKMMQETRKTCSPVGRDSGLHHVLLFPTSSFMPSSCFSLLSCPVEPVSVYCPLLSFLSFSSDDDAVSVKTSP